MIHFFDAGAPKGYLVVFQQAAAKFEVIKSGCLSPEQLEYAAAKPVSYTHLTLPTKVTV